MLHLYSALCKTLLKR